METFDKDQLVDDCLVAVRSGGGAFAAAKDIVERVVAEPTRIEQTLGDTATGAMMTTWHQSDELTVLHLVWPPEVELFAHDHNMWAVIGVYGGREDNQFYRHVGGGRVEPHTTKTLLAKDAVALGQDVVHSVSNPTREWTAAIHVYGGDFFTAPRSMWSTDTLERSPLDVTLIGKTLDAAATKARAAE